MPFVHDPVPRYSPCLLLGLPDLVPQARTFRRRGWDVYHASAGPVVRRLARMLGPDLVLLDLHLPEESCWLTCAKILADRPCTPILLLAEEPTSHLIRWGRFAGALGVVGQHSEFEELVGLLLGKARAA